MGWSGIAALGEAAKGAGDYFGTLHSETVKAQRLADARAQQVADRDLRYEREDTIRAENIERNDALRAEDIERDDSLTADERAYNEERDALKRRQSLEDSDTKHSRALESAEAKGKKGKLTEGDKRLALRANLGGQYLDNMKSLLESGYESGSMGTYGEVVANKFDMTRRFSSKETQIMEASKEGVVAAILRTDTGAAAPTDEQVRYTRRLVPGIGEGPEVVEWKIKVLEKSFDAMASASEAGATSEEIRSAGLAAAYRFELDQPRPEEEEPATSPVNNQSATTRRSVQSTSVISDRAQRYLRGE